MGPQVCHLLVTLSVALSLALFTLGGADPTGGSFLQTLSFGRPLDNRATYLGYDCCILCCRSWRDVRGVGNAM
jgi:hypothetical protein